MNIRKLALDTLCKCESAAQYSNIALDSKIKKFNISGDDRALFTVLVYGVIENKLTLDHFINALSSLPDEKIDALTRNILRLGIYQINFMRTSDHAAVNETVSLAPARSRGFVNAIVRNFIRKKDSIQFPDREVDPAGYLSAAYSFPKDTCRFFIDRFGINETEKFLSATNESSSRPMTLRVNTIKNSSEELLSALRSAGIEAERSKNLPNALKLSNGCSFYELEKVSDGGFFVQDQASQLAVAALDARPGQRVIDMCACPGSKSFGAAVDMENRGEILSFDISKSKLPLISSGAERLGINIIKSELHDGRDLIVRLENSADRIICDVPCSGFGVISKKPEIRYKNIADTSALPGIQYDILCTASKYLKSGGFLVYSTCTVLPEENEDNIRRFLLEHKDFKAVPFSVGELSAPEGMLTLMPHIHGTDGFFICKLTKI